MAWIAVQRTIVNECGNELFRARAHQLQDLISNRVFQTTNHNTNRATRDARDVKSSRTRPTNYDTYHQSQRQSDSPQNSIHTSSDKLALTDTTLETIVDTDSDSEQHMDMNMNTILFNEQ